MRNKTVTQWLLCTLGLWLLSQQCGQCFYDPGPQRWLNRDPVGDIGFHKQVDRIRTSVDGGQLYTYTRNRAVNATDPLGLTIWLCTRTTVGLPLLGYGRHAYLWDDRPSLARLHSCSEQGSYANNQNPGTTTEQSEVGPIDSTGLDLPPYPGLAYNDRTTGAQCYPIPGTEGMEDTIMNHCHHCANQQWWLPPISDCHTACERVMGDLGYNDLPPHPRYDPPGRPPMPLPMF